MERGAMEDPRKRLAATEAQLAQMAEQRQVIEKQKEPLEAQRLNIVDLKDGNKRSTATKRSGRLGRSR